MPPKKEEKKEEESGPSTVPVDILSNLDLDPSMKAILGLIQQQHKQQMTTIFEMEKICNKAAIVTDLEEQIEHEEQARQKLQLDSVDQKMLVREKALAAMKRVLVVAESTRNTIAQKLSKMQAEYDTIARKREEGDQATSIHANLRINESSLNERWRQLLEVEEDRQSLITAKSAVAQKKLESQIMEVEQQLEAANRWKEDYNKQLKKSQQMMKEYQQDAEDARQAKEEFAASLRESERKSRSLEVENHRLQEANDNLLSQKRQLEADIEEANDNLLSQKRQLEADIEELEELRSKGGKNLLLDERRLLESKIAQFEEQLEEEQGNVELAQDKRRKAEQQVESLINELSMEKVICHRLDAEKQALERTNRELRSKITELESSTQTPSRAQIAALEAKIQNLERLKKIEEKPQKKHRSRGPDGRFTKEST